MTKPLTNTQPRYLWLTRFFPYPPHAGDRIYSARLIEALADQNSHVAVFCNLGQPDSALIPTGTAQQVEWIGCPPAGKGRMARYPFSRLPRQALRLSDPGAQQALGAILIQESWDAILIDYVSMGWVLPLLEDRLKASNQRPALVYVAHNHEASLRRQAVSQSTAPLIMRLAQWVDGKRAAALERRLLSAVDYVTVNTKADLELFRADAPQQHYQVLVPGYDGPRLANRTITAETPRRVVVVGSFDWIVKQQNLEGFLEAAHPLTDHGIGIDIVGSGPENILQEWRRRFPHATIHGRVDAVEPYIQGARMSIIPEKIGGGFKHKVLNAIFQRSPIFSITGAITEVPLINGQSMHHFPDFIALIQGIIQNIDNFDDLNALQTTAYTACQDQFHWGDRGKSLHQMLTR